MTPAAPPRPGQILMILWPKDGSAPEVRPIADLPSQSAAEATRTGKYSHVALASIYHTERLTPAPDGVSTRTDPATI